MPSTRHRLAGALVLLAAGLAALAVFPSYDGRGSLVDDTADLSFALAYVLILAVAGVCLLRSSDWGALFLVGVTASVGAVYATGAVSAVHDHTRVGTGWWLDNASFALVLGATVLVAVALVKSAGTGLGMSMSSAVVLAVGFFLVVVYVVGKIVPLGQISAAEKGMVVKFAWGALFDGDDSIHRIGHIAGIALAGGTLLLTSLVRPLRLGVAVLAGWALAEAAGLVADSVNLLRAETVNGTHFSGDAGLGMVVRTATLVLMAALVGMVALAGRRRRLDAAPADEAGEPELMAVS